MNDNYEPAKQDYIRTLILGVLYTLLVQLLNFSAYKIAKRFNEGNKSRFVHHLYWTVTTALKYLTILILLYPQIGEVMVPRSEWNVTFSQILIIGTVITATECLINLISIRMHKSILYHFYTRSQFKQYKLAIESNEQRRKSSISQIYNIKMNLKQQQVFQKYYASDENSLMVNLTMHPPLNNDYNNQKQNGKQELNKQTLILGSDSESRIIPTPSHQNVQDTSLHGSDRQKSRGSLKKNSHLKVLPTLMINSFDNTTATEFVARNGDDVEINTATTTTDKNSTSDDPDEAIKRFRLLWVIGLLNTQEYLLNLEVPLDSRNDLDLCNDFYEMLIHAPLLNLTSWWKLDNLIFNLFECLCISTVFLYRVTSRMTLVIVILLIIGRSLRYELWRLWLIVQFQRQSDSYKIHHSYGSISELTFWFGRYCRRCQWLTCLSLTVDLLALVMIVFFIRL